ncbi:unnamed protein product (macronuclear) [Paramecium tetraurelia]|uniref:Uncharacterized protein n=1 Tax=Paramecium tetraurelia TaxID=5888 RepID=A0DFU9_PARTE|nr:uncharacterized protein GSPATT00039478001 [Paramecium tetraurelia]CAK81916.1 unnamed protein product [Paramecium tetraurelia]|eukprot:XP_001449313.1 hypothetical protein (macronuclear) [Paramecium tetraurelia strain d4-2]
MRKEDQIHLSSLQIWNGMDTPVHQSSNIFSEKFKQSSEFHYNCNQPFCLQHPEKKAKYVLLNAEGPNEKLCTKCAVVFAQQGHKIQLIEEGTLMVLNILQIMLRRNKLTHLQINYSRPKAKSTTSIQISCALRQIQKNFIMTNILRQLKHSETLKMQI